VAPKEKPGLGRVFYFSAPGFDLLSPNGGCN
jgi:hypothetical protein